MIRLLALLALAFAGSAAAQLRTIPADAKLGEIRHVQTSLVELNGKPALLSPGAQIRDTDNRLILPVAVVRKTAVKYLLDASGKVHRIWILSAKEKAEEVRKAKAAPKTLPAAK